MAETTRSATDAPQATATATAGAPAPSYGENASGQYDYNGNSNVPGLATAYYGTLQQAEAAWYAANPQYTNAGDGVANDTAGGTVYSNSPIDGILGITPGTATAPTSTTPGASDPFTQLASLLSGLATQGAGGTLPASTDTPSQAVPTQSGPSIVLPLLLVIAAGALAYWYWKSHHKHAHAAE